MMVENNNKINFKLSVADVNYLYAFFLCFVYVKAKKLKLYVLTPSLI